MTIISRRNFNRFNCTNITSINNLIRKEIIMLNIQWEKHKDLFRYENHNIIPIIDLTHNMELYNNTPLYTVLGLGIRLSEISYHKNTLITISQKPLLIKFNESDMFMDKLKKIFYSFEKENISMGVEGNLYNSLNIILQECIFNAMTQNQIDLMNIVILSDMQTDLNIRKNSTDIDLFKCITEKIYDKFKETGYKSIGKAYYAPHIIYWNMRNTNGFPYNSSKNDNISVLSGYSFNTIYDLITNIKGSFNYKKYQPNMLKEKKEEKIIKHISCIKKYSNTNNTRWEKLQKKLNITRYNFMESILIDAWNTYDESTKKYS